MQCELCGNPIRKSNTTGICSRNLECSKEAARRRAANRRADHPELVKDSQRRHYASLRGKAGSLLTRSRMRARDKGLPFDLTTEWMVSELETAVENGCPYLGIPIRLDAPVGSPDCPSVDQFIPGAGYTQGNCIIVSFKANAMKRDASPEFVKMLGDNVDRLARTRFRRAA